MSKIIAFGMDNMSVGEFTAVCNRGWSLQGVASTASGGSTTITVSEDIMKKGWLNPGMMVLVLDESLPPWAGVVDPPISLLTPNTITLYNPEYLLTLRSLERVNNTAKGTLALLIDTLIRMTNVQGDLYVRTGIAGGPSTVFSVSVDAKSMWEQISIMAKQYGVELFMRPQREPSDGNRLYLYLDIQDRVGVDTGFLLHDGKNENMKISRAVIDQPVWNRVVGVNSAQSANERFYTTPLVNPPSANAFRQRGILKQFEAADYTALLAKSTNYINTYGVPVIKFDIMIMDRGDTFKYLSPGNSVLLHSTKVTMPDGRQGWRGPARIMAMAYNEKDRTVGATVEAKYEF
jgi:hypothetical protein